MCTGGLLAGDDSVDREMPLQEGHHGSVEGRRLRDIGNVPGLIADCTVEGLLRAPELPQILAGGSRGRYISHEHP
jgi:hypothetical protein